MTSTQILIAFIAGVISTALMLTASTSPAIGFPFLFVCALPIAIASLGWGSYAGFVSAGIGAIGIATSTHAGNAFYYIAIFGGSVAYLGHLIGLSRQETPDNAVEWFPLGDVLFRAALFAAIVFGIGFVVTNFNPTLIADAFIANLAAQFEQIGQDQPENFEESIRSQVRFIPFILPMVWLLMICFNFWLAAKIVRRWQLFDRPSLTFKTEELPNFVIAGVGVGCILSFLAAPPLGYAGEALLGAMGGTLFIMGCVTLHVVTGKNAVRTLILSAVYGSMLFFHDPIFLVAGLGLADLVLKIRQRYRLANPI